VVSSSLVWRPEAHIPLVTILQADMHPANRGFIWWKEPPLALPTPAPILNKILAEHGLGPIRKVEDLFAGDLTLMLGMPETDPLPPQTSVTYIGPILWQKPDATPPDWFAQLDRGKPVIWVYSGNPRYLPISMPMDSSVVIRSCLAALAQEDVQVVLTTGHHPLPKDVLPLPANFRHEPYVPGLIMAQRSQVMIHHGGYGSCQTGLYTGTPAVIIPLIPSVKAMRAPQCRRSSGIPCPNRHCSGKENRYRPTSCAPKSNWFSQRLRMLKTLPPECEIAGLRRCHLCG
jgi:UDP:flavonoid glycosyltransferase YjiC (YdhE family)